MELSDFIDFEKVKHSYVLTTSDLLDLDVTGAFWRKTAKIHPIGKTTYQAFSPRCAGEAVVNMAESMGLPRLDPLIVYKKAKSLDLIPDYKAGTHIWAAAEAYCSMVKGIKWTHLPLQNGVEYLGKWLLSRGCIAVGMNWTQNDYNPGFGNIIEGGGQIVGGHAVNIYGIHPKYQWKRYPFLGPFSKTREADCFCLENSNSKEKTYKVTMYRLQKDLTEMVGLIKTT